MTHLSNFGLWRFNPIYTSNYFQYLNYSKTDLKNYLYSFTTDFAGSSENAKYVNVELNNFTYYVDSSSDYSLVYSDYFKDNQSFYGYYPWEKGSPSPWIDYVSIKDYYYNTDKVTKGNIKAIDPGTFCTFKEQIFRMTGDDFNNKSAYYLYVDAIDGKKTIRFRLSNSDIEGASVVESWECKAPWPITRLIVSMQAAGGNASTSNWNTYGNGGGGGAAAKIILNFRDDVSSYRFLVETPLTDEGGEHSGTGDRDIEIHFNKNDSRYSWHRIGTIGGGGGAPYGQGGDDQYGKGGVVNFNTEYTIDSEQNPHYHILLQANGGNGISRDDSKYQAKSRSGEGSCTLYPSPLSTCTYNKTSCGGTLYQGYNNGQYPLSFGLGGPSPNHSDSLPNIAGTVQPYDPVQRPWGYDGRPGVNGGGGFGRNKSGSNPPGGQGGQPFIEFYF